LNMENYDLIIIGAGPAGISAGIYACRTNIKVLIIEAESTCSKLYKTDLIENYPGLLSISGIDLAMELNKQAEKLNIKIINATVSKIDGNNLYLSNGDVYFSKYFIVATGTKEKALDLQYSDKFTGKGISYCATCDGFFFKKKDVIVIGNSNKTLKEALYLAKITNSVSIINDRDYFTSDDLTIDEVTNNEKIKIFYNSVPKNLIIENDSLNGLTISNLQTSKSQDIIASGIFPYIGSNPNTYFVDKKVLDEAGYIITNRDMSTDIENLYAAGDCTQKQLRQIVTACSDGAIAASSIIKKLK